MTAKRTTLYSVLGRNPVHPFPARMAPELVVKFLSEQKNPIRVLDPMMGSGTVLALAQSKGHRTYGVDVDPLAVLVSQAWTSSIEPMRAAKEAEKLLARAERRFREISAKDAYPKNATKETREFIAYWFDARSRRQLTSLSICIKNVKDESLKNVFWCAFSRLIIVKQAGASRAMDLAHSRPHRAYKVSPIRPFDKFLASVKYVADNCAPQDGLVKRKFRAKIDRGDARRLSIESNSIDLVLTSPPYLNAIDYIRCSKFSLVWMGYNVEQLRKIRSTSVGCEIGVTKLSIAELEKIVRRLGLNHLLPNRQLAVLNRYIEDMHQAISETARVLNAKGKAIYVIGENTVRGAFIPNARLIREVAKVAGLKFERMSIRTLPENRRYLPPPSKGSSGKIDTRMRREVVLTFAKGY